MLDSIRGYSEINHPTLGEYPKRRTRDVPCTTITDFVLNFLFFNERLILAIKKKDIVTLKSLLGLYNVPKSNLNSLFLLATQIGDLEIVKLLSNYIKDLSEDEITDLICNSSYSEKYEITEYFLEHTIHKLDKKIDPILEDVIQFGKTSLFKIIFEKHFGKELNSAIFDYILLTVESKQFDMFNLLLERYDLSNHETLKELLTTVCRNQLLEYLTPILKKRIPKESLTEPLIIAVRKSNLSIAKVLIDNGANVSKAFTASLQFPAEAGNLELIKLILEKYALSDSDVSVVLRAIRGAIFSKKDDVAKYLLLILRPFIIASSKISSTTIEFSDFIGILSRLNLESTLSFFLDFAIESRIELAKIIGSLNYALKAACEEKHVGILSILLEKCPYNKRFIKQLILEFSEIDYIETNKILIDSFFKSDHSINPKIIEIAHELLEHPNIHIKHGLLDKLISDSLIEHFDRVINTPGFTPKQIQTLMYSLLLNSIYYDSNHDIKMFLKKYHVNFKYSKSIEALLQFQIALLSSNFTVEKQQTIMLSIFKKDSFKEVVALMGIVTAILSIDSEKLIGIKDEEWSKEFLSRLISDKLIRDGYFPEGGILPFIQSRNPKALFDYCSRHKDEKIKSLILYFTSSVLDGSFRLRRNSNNSHLEYLNEDQRDKWKTALETISITSGEKTAFDVGEFLQHKLVTDKHAEGLVRPDLLKKKHDDLNPLEAAILNLKIAKKSQYLEKLKVIKDLLEGQECEFKNDIDAQISLLTRGHSTNSYQLVDSDDPFDLFLCGTDVLGSCQRVDGDPYLNQCLMGYVLDGKSRLLLVKDPETGQIISRAIIKILIDEASKPQLFFERVYGDRAFEKQIKELAKEKADTMGVRIYQSASESGILLRSYGNFAKLEYEDGLRGGGVNNGFFELLGVEFDG